MAEITAALIKQLRDKTNAGMMNCKAALKEADGDLEAAETVLRKKGIAKAESKGDREAKEGIIDAALDSDSRVGAILEFTTETDFVAKNEEFQAFVATVTTQIVKEGAGADTNEAILATSYDGGTLEEGIKAKFIQVGENISLRRFQRYAVADGSQGVIAKYIHLAGKVGVLVEIGCEKAESTSADSFRDLVKDITLQIAASAPIAITREEIDPKILAKEREIYVDQVKDKPANIIDRIVDGKLDKFCSQIALLEQAYIKDGDKSIGDLLGSVGKDLGDTLTVRRFARYAVGDGA